MTIGLDVAAMNMAAAMICGAVIGTERQARHRMAGVRTNALVALSAASFVIFASLFPQDASPTRVAAQIVSGIGFLGGGLIFRDGLTVHGLNTAATLWCSAAVGMMAGTGALPFALMLTGMVMVINLGLRPMVNWLKRKTSAGVPAYRQCRIEVTCRSEREAELRGLILRTLMLSKLQLSGIEAHATHDGAVDIAATVTGEGAADGLIEQAVARLAVEPGLMRVSWQLIDES